jgi:hypothetical protein
MGVIRINKQRGTETNNGLITLNATLTVKDSRNDAETVKQAAIVIVIIVVKTLANG